MRTIINKNGCFVFCFFIFSVLVSCHTTKNAFYESLAWYRYQDSPFRNEFQKNYIELKNGERVFGDKISWSAGLLRSDTKIDKQKFKTKNLKCMVVGNSYYRPVRGQYAELIISGKLNVYRMVSPSSYFGAGGYFLQKGENGDLIIWKDLKGLSSFIKDCPLALKTLNDIKMKSIEEWVHSLALPNIVIAYNNCSN